MPLVSKIDYNTLVLLLWMKKKSKWPCRSDKMSCYFLFFVSILYFISFNKLISRYYAIKKSIFLLFQCKYLEKTDNCFATHKKIPFFCKHMESDYLLIQILTTQPLLLHVDKMKNSSHSGEYRNKTRNYIILIFTQLWQLIMLQFYI